MSNYPPPGRLRRPTSPARGEVHRVRGPALHRVRCTITPLLHLLHIDPDRAAAGEPDLPGGLVGDAEFERLGLAALDHVERLGDHRALDTAAGDRAEEIALVVDDQVRADRPRRRAPGLHDGGERHALAGLTPVLGGFEDIVIGCEGCHGDAFPYLTCRVGKAKPREARRSVPTITVHRDNALVGTALLRCTWIGMYAWTAPLPTLQLSGRFQPFLRIPAPSAMGRERADQVSHSLQIVNRTQFVNMRQH